jgi:hypothetical protein
MQRGRPDPGEATEALVDILTERVAAATAEKLVPFITSEVSRMLTAERPEDPSEHLEGS